MMSAVTVTRPQKSPGLKRGKSYLGTTVFATLLIGTLAFGWHIRDEYLLTAERGVGYALGVMGASCMALLLVYPLRKRLPRSSLLIFSTPVWFRIHMVLGLVGPVAILFHCNFGLGSFNSNIALWSMLLMVSSGLVGRYLYSRIHLGLYGRRLELADLRREKFAVREILEKTGSRGHLRVSREFVKLLADIEQQFAQASSGLRGVLTATFGERRLARDIECRLRDDQSDNPAFLRLSASEQSELLDRVNRDIRLYLRVVRRLSEFAVFERLFSLWHMLHLPIFFMLVATACVHIYAVHSY